MSTAIKGGAIAARKADRLAASVGAMLTLADFAATLKIGRSTAERLLAAGKLPQPDLRLSSRLIRWRASTVERFIAGSGGGAR